MNELERFNAIARGETPDYVPIFGFGGAPGMSAGCMKKTHDRLVATGMPSEIGASVSLTKGSTDVESWYRYWGTTGPTGGPWSLAYGAKGFKVDYRIEDGLQVIESESGEVTRQVIDNDITYIMPEFVSYAVRDRESWEFWKERSTPTQMHPPEKMEEMCRPYDQRDRPVTCGVSGAYAFLRGLMGPENLSLTLHDDPELVHDMAAWNVEQTRKYNLPIIERVRPEIVQMGEDLCYNHGMLLSPAHFHEFCGPHYRMVCDAAKACGSQMVAVDTDGDCMEFIDVAAPYGVNAFFPNEVKAGNDLFEVRRKHPEVVLFGWLEKEVVNEGNEAMIEPEITSKVPPLLAKGRYFPNGDHGLQPLVTFDSLRKFMTILHEVCGNPEGEFPRV